MDLAQRLDAVSRDSTPESRAIRRSTRAKHGRLAVCQAGVDIERKRLTHRRIAVRSKLLRGIKNQQQTRAFPGALPGSL